MSIPRRPRPAYRPSPILRIPPARPLRAVSLCVGLAFAFGVAPLATPEAQGAQTKSPLEYQVRAAYLFKFLPFVEWPDQQTGADEPFAVCIVGDSPFGAELEQLAAQQRVNGHAPVVRRLRRIARGSGCRMLYMGDAAEQSAGEILRAVRGTPCLTISEDNTDDDSVIQFQVRDNRVRFSVNLDAAARNGLTLSSKLLGLALSVRKGARS